MPSASKIPLLVNRIIAHSRPQDCTEEENSPIYQRQVKLNYDTNQQSESNETPSFQLQISEKIIHRRSPPTLHHRLTITMLKIGIEKIQEMNNHFHRNESYIPTASANLTTLPISEQNFILVDESVTHPKMNLPYVVSNIPRLISFNSKCSTHTGTQYLASTSDDRRSITYYDCTYDPEDDY